MVAEELRLAVVGRDEGQHLSETREFLLLPPLGEVSCRVVSWVSQVSFTHDGMNA